MAQTIKLSQEQTDFIKQMANTINGNWYYLPFWFHEVGENTFEVVGFDKLPKHLKEKISEVIDELNESLK
jgi:hypothetical protein